MNKIPRQVQKILHALTATGHTAHIVGGAVRDLLLGRSVSDFDVTTSAQPEQVMAVACQSGWKVIDQLGKNFGVVILSIDGEQIEVTTWRGERYGADSHRPEAVWFAKSLEEDLGRRDFTVNAMALAADGTIIDPFGGQVDLAAGVLRAVGNPQVRFREDGLRMFRACRFAAQLGFALAPATEAAIGLCLERVTGLSLERVRAELEKILLSQSPHRGLDLLVQTGLAAASCRMKREGEYQVVAILPELNHLAGLPQNPAYHCHDGWQHTLAAVKAVRADLTLRWAALLHDIGKGMPQVRGTGKDGQPTDYGHDKVGAAMTEGILTRLQITPKLRERIVWLVARHMKFHFYANGNKANVARWVRDEARSGRFRTTAELAKAFSQLSELGAADVIATGRCKMPASMVRDYGRMLTETAQAMPVHTSDISYEAGELAQILKSKQRIGPFLKNALNRIQDGSLENSPEAVHEAARRWALRR